jgi:hypothetical protein
MLSLRDRKKIRTSVLPLYSKLQCRFYPEESGKEKKASTLEMNGENGE